MQARILIVAGALGLAGILPAGAATEEEAVRMARSLSEQHKDAVVRVEAVLEIELSGSGVGTVRRQERKIQVLGTVIDESGLTAVSHLRLDPASIYEGRTIERQGRRVRLSAKTDYSEVKVLLADGTKLPAKIVLKDADLDLAFVLPDADSEEMQGRELKALDFSTGAEGQPLDRTIRLTRLGSALNYETAVKLGRIASVVTKPRTFYVSDNHGAGTPIFTAEGGVLGLALMRMIDKGGDRRSVAQVILPAEDVWKVARQALESPQEPSGKAEGPAATRPAPPSGEQED